MKNNQDLGLLLLRIALGVVFIVHGWAKWQNMEGTIQFFSSLGLPAMLAYIVAAIELLGGLAILFGLWHRLAGWLLAAVMLGAIITVKGSKGFVGGYELDFVLLLVAAALAMMHPGKYLVIKKSRD